MSTVVCNCIVCNSMFTNIVDTDTKVLITKEQIFRSCSKYFNAEIDISNTLNFDLSKEPLPFCANCFLSAHKILTLHEQIEVLERDINKIVADLKTSILKCVQEDTGCFKGKNEKSNTPRGNATLQEKVHHYRLLVLSGSGLSQGVEESDYYVAPSGGVQIKHESIDIDFEDDFSCAGPPYHDSEDYQSEHESEKVGVQRQKNEIKVLPTASEKWSDSLLKQIKLHGMDKRKPIIKLNRDSVLQFPSIKSKTPKISIQKQNSHRIKSRNFSTNQSQLLMKPSWTKDGSKILCGVIYKTTVDGKQQCGSCDKIFINSTKLTRHIRDVHSGVKPKSFYVPKGTSKAFKVVKDADGKTSYAGVEFISLEFGKIQCGNCDKMCPTVDAVLRHIRWYHLGDTATEMYRQRREVYKLKRMAVLGKKVPKEKLKEVEEALKEKLYVTTIVKKAITTGDTDIPMQPLSSCSTQSTSVSTVKPEPILKRNLTKNSNRKFTFDKNEIKKERKSNIQWKDDSEEENDLLEPSHEDNVSNDPDFSPIHSPCGSLQGDTSNSEGDTDSENDVKKTRNEYKVKQRDGKKFYCDIELLGTEDDQHECGECKTKVKTLLDLCRHIEDLHKPQAMQKNLKSIRSTQNKGKHSKRSSGVRSGWTRRSSRKKSWVTRNCSPSREHEKVEEKDGKLIYRSVELKIQEDGTAECGECQKICSCKRALMRHISKHHNLQDQFSQLQKAESSNNKIYRTVEICDAKDGRFGCGRCWKSFATVDDVKRHIRCIHDSDKDPQKSEAEQDSELKTCFTDEGFVYNGILCKKSEKGDCYRCGFECPARPVCDREFASSYRLISHIKRDHLAKREFKRIHRNVTTKDGRKLYAGVEVVELEDGRAECGKCKKISANVKSLCRHIYDYHIESIQEKIFARLPSSQHEKRIYEGVEIADTKDGKFACGRCWRCFRAVDHAKRHIRDHHPGLNKSEVNPENDLKQQKEKPNNNVEDNNSNEAPENENGEGNCDNPTSTQKDSKTNNASKTPEEAYFTEDGFVYNGTLCQKSKSSDGYLCGFSRFNRPVCGNEFPSTFTLVNHIRKIHLEKVRNQPAKERFFNRTVTTDDGRKIYAGVEMIKVDDEHLQCGACQKVFKKIRLSSLMGHIIRVHEQKEGHYICRYCGKNCGFKFWLIAHELRHKEEKKFVCEDCGLSYKQMSSLLHHKRQVHLKIKRHTCKICGKGYYHTRDFLIHQRRHTGEKPFQCCFCGKDFYSEYEMKVHEKVHHKSEVVRTGTTKQQSGKRSNLPSEESFVNNEQQGTSTRSNKRTSKRRKVTGKGRSVGGIECDYCDEVFKTTAAVKKHMLQEHSGSSESETEDLSTPKSETIEIEIENRQGRGLPATTIAPNNLSQQKYPTSSWQNEISNFSMPVLHNMNPIRQNLHNWEQSVFPPLLTPMQHPHNNAPPHFTPFPPHNY